MIRPTPLPQKTINLINKDNTRLRLPRQTEQPCDQLITISEPFARERGSGDVDERRARLFGKRFGEHGFPTAGGSVEQDTFRGGDEGRGGCEEVWVEEGEDDGFAQGGDDFVKAANV